eukprot:15112195-Alexandrium_andersonii.AAC.1
MWHGAMLALTRKWHRATEAAATRSLCSTWPTRSARVAESARGPVRRRRTCTGARMRSASWKG